MERDISGNSSRSTDTIVAPMTPAGVSAVAALRVSGSRVRDVVRRLFGDKPADALQPRVANLGTACDPETGRVLDSLLYIFFAGPNSYTGEDVLELYPHGNPLIVRDLMQAIRSLDGVRLADPGEYTRRAFLNGKMDLAQAESVADVIHSANRAELENAHRLLSGALSKKIAALTAQVKDISARLELDVDFAEEEADPDYSGWQEKFEGIRASIRSLLESFRGNAALRKIPLAVLYGAPNAGKSSLVNALLGEDRLLVSNIPGTTRDFVEVRLFLPGGEIRLVDTAGIADTATDELDALSQKKSREILEEADMKILVVDSLAPAGLRSDAPGTHISKGEGLEGHPHVISKGEGLEGHPHVIAGERCDCGNLAPDVVVYSKSDLRRVLPGGSRRPESVGPIGTSCLQGDNTQQACLQGDSSRQACLDNTQQACLEGDGRAAISISSKTGEGLADLRRLMNAALFKENTNAEDLWITSEREKACLEEALAGVDRALDLLRDNPAVELLAFEMQVVRRALQSITGEISSEDILQSIFAGFCIGK